MQTVDGVVERMRMGREDAAAAAALERWSQSARMKRMKRGNHDKQKKMLAAKENRRTKEKENGER